MTLVTVDTHTDAWVAALRAGFDLILFGLDGLAYGGCVHAVVCKYAARRCDDGERVARAYGECVRGVFDDCSR